MKPLIVIVSLVILVMPTPVTAQQVCRLDSAEGKQVFVIDLDSREWQGTLLKASKDRLTVESEAGTREFLLANVKRVDADGDRIRDGAIKGAVFGLALGAFSAAFGGSGRAMIAGTVLYGLVGASLDALNHSKQTVYSPAQKVAMTVTW